MSTTNVETVSSPADKIKLLLAVVLVGLALAVGGYGRGELFPYSDIDVLVLLPVVPSVTGEDLSAPRIEAFISACWDIGLEIGSSVRTVAECAEEAQRDVTVQTALLESRFICGTRTRFDELEASTHEHMDVPAFLTAKLLEMRQRHTKYEDTPYALEPNCKESPGGLRDLQVVLWLARAARLGRNWAELARNGLLTPFEARQLQRNEGLLKLIRTRLHQLAGRREDRLVFDLQTAVATSFGYESTKALRASEALMRRYYWAAKAVTQLSRILGQNLEDRLLGHADLPAVPINERFVERGGLLDLVHDHVYLGQSARLRSTVIGRSSNLRTGVVAEGAVVNVDNLDEIVDLETGTTVLPVGQSGEIRARGPQIMQGYRQLPDETATALRDGWLYTGDIGEFDTEGYLFIRDRKKDMVIVGGFNVYPREVEEYLYTHPAVLDVQVIGVPSEKYGEEVMAWLRLRPGATVADEDLVAFCRGQIATYKIPRYWKVVSEFPTTVTGKVQKFRMREIAVAELGLEHAARRTTA